MGTENYGADLQISLKLIGLGIEPDPDRMCDPKLVSPTLAPRPHLMLASAALIGLQLILHALSRLGSCYNTQPPCMPRVQVAEATQRVEARYEDALDSAVLRGVAARTRLVPQASHPSSTCPKA